MLTDAYYAIITFMERGGQVVPLIAVLTFVIVVSFVVCLLSGPGVT